MKRTTSAFWVWYASDASSKRLGTEIARHVARFINF
jgi:hypothetical protein